MQEVGVRKWSFSLLWSTSYLTNSGFCKNKIRTTLQMFLLLLLLLGETKRKPNSSLRQKTLPGVPETFQWTCLCPVSQWHCGPHALCYKETYEFQHKPSFIQLQWTDMKWIGSVAVLVLDTWESQKRICWKKNKSRRRGWLGVDGKEQAQCET